MFKVRRGALQIHPRLGRHGELGNTYIEEKEYKPFSFQTIPSFDIAFFTESRVKKNTPHCTVRVVGVESMAAHFPHTINAQHASFLAPIVSVVTLKMSHGGCFNLTVGLSGAVRPIYKLF